MQVHRYKARNGQISGQWNYGAVVHKVVHYNVCVGGSNKCLVGVEIAGEGLTTSTVELTKDVVEQQYGLMVGTTFELL